MVFGPQHCVLRRSHRSVAPPLSPAEHSAECGEQLKCGAVWASAVCTAQDPQERGAALVSCRGLLFVGGLTLEAMQMRHVAPEVDQRAANTGGNMHAPIQS